MTLGSGAVSRQANRRNRAFWYLRRHTVRRGRVGVGRIRHSILMQRIACVPSSAKKSPDIGLDCLELSALLKLGRVWRPPHAPYEISHIRLLLDAPYPELRLLRRDPLHDRRLVVAGGPSVRGGSPFLCSVRFSTHIGRAIADGRLKLLNRLCPGCSR